MNRIPLAACVGMVFLLLATAPARALDADLGRYLVAKQQQIRDFADTITNKVPAVVWRFYDAVRVDDWETATNVYDRIRLASHRYAETTNDDAITPALGTLVWPPLMESFGSYERFHHTNAKWLHRFGDGIIASIPRGGVYLGGTDPGRFVVSALCESQVEGKPFFTLTQNQLADGTYLDYLRAMYGKKIHLFTAADSQNFFTDYSTDADRREKQGRLKPGEQVARDKNGRVQISGQVSVMEINGLMAQKIFEDNPGREFFVEESFPLDWMYPHLTPHGLIMQLNRKPLESISVSDMDGDRDYWKKLFAEMFGGWLDEKTPVKDVCDFAEKYGLGKNLENFKGDQAFAGDADSRKCFSKLRSSQAGLFAWRAEHTKDADERDRMYRAADLAFRQAYVICPYSPEALYRYINLFLQRGRTDDAALLARTSLHLQPDNQQFKMLLDQLLKTK